jgi:hypothetical protein
LKEISTRASLSIYIGCRDYRPLRVRSDLAEVLVVSALQAFVYNNVKGLLYSFDRLVMANVFVLFRGLNTRFARKVSTYTIVRFLNSIDTIVRISWNTFQELERRERKKIEKDLNRLPKEEHKDAVVD